MGTNKVYCKCAEVYATWILNGDAETFNNLFVLQTKKEE